ncbi:MAG: ABC transporter substrate-binding protein [Candidatus Binatia bacterium]|nr:ABC transporter substrate-binding protein [Candidatus Binatia bacterium]
MRIRRLTSFCVIAAVVFGVVSQGWGETPAEIVKQLIGSVRSYKNTDNSAAQVRKVTEETLAIQELAQHVLGPQWGKLSAREQQDFVQLLQDLVQKVAYPKSAEFFRDLQIEFTTERVNGNEAEVETVVSHPQEGVVTIGYRLRQKAGRWVITDVLLDDVSLVTNLRTQMQQVIAKESYQGLVRRMREKLAEES